MLQSAKLRADTLLTPVHLLKSLFDTHKLVVNLTRLGLLTWLLFKNTTLISFCSKCKNRAPLAD